LDTPRKFHKPPSNIVYDIDGASYGMDDDLVAAIQASIRTRLKSGTLEIPRLPQVAGRILQLSQDSDVDFDEVTQVIMSDPALAARMMTIANSATYAGNSQVAGLDGALMRLGLKNVCNIVFTESIQTKVFSARSYRPLVEQSWRRSLGCAIACENLSYVTGIEREAAFLLGLLHDTGKPSLVNAVAEYERKNQGLSLGEASVEILLSQLHEETGAHVLQQWGMPEPIVEAAGSHTRYRGSGLAKPAEQLVYASLLICEHLGIGSEPREIAFNLEHVFVDLGLGEPGIADPIVEATSAGLERLTSGLGMAA
jgi:HD-like signal output (HDOD) protein